MKTAPRPTAISIGQTERDTGLSKDTLRIWERRYGFPQPIRDAGGERHYDADQVEKLRLIKRLLDTGERPGKLVGKSLAELSKFGAERPAMRARQDTTEAEGGIVELLKTRDGAALQLRLSQLLTRNGLQQFVMRTLAPLNTAIGDAWARGEIATFDEHLYTENVQSLLRSVVQSLPRRADGPRVLLTTLPQELHVLGLLMVEALLAAEGVPCVSLGTQTPVQDVIAAASVHRADIVALSFSASFSIRAAEAGLATVRRELPAHMALWAGGGLTGRLKALPDGIECFPALDGVLPAIQRWRERNTTTIKQGSN
jgi:MerR family transcriptional regulator, light-induced transcriptional regulator